MNKQSMYRKEKFEGYTHRFIVEFEVGDPYHHSLTLYSDSDSYFELEKFISKNKSDKVLFFRIVHRASKEQDERVTEFLKDFLNI